MQIPAEKALLELLIFRLERISVDSYWAHRASGVRGSLIRILDGMDGASQVTQNVINEVTELGFYILEQAVTNK